MKKLLLALTAAVSCAFFAKADTTFNQTGFEDLTAGETLDPAKDDAGGTTQAYWSYAGDMSNMGCVISNYASGAGYTYGEGNAALVQDGPGSNYLWVDASEAPLVRNVNPFVGDGHAAQAIGDGLYFDSLVQFTATDQAPSIDANQDKLIVWLYGGDAESELFGAATGLVVTAGYVDGAASTMPSNYVVTLGSGIDVKPGEWHRLTIKAISNITEDGKSVPEAAISGFVVFVDGQPVTCDDIKGDFYNVGGLTTDATALGNKLFPSLLKAGVGAGSLVGVAFDGTGAIDDLTFTDVDPFPEAVTTFDFTLSFDEDAYDDYAVYGVKSGQADVAISDVEIGVAKAIEAGAYDQIKVVFTPADDYTVTGPAGYTMDGDSFVFLVNAAAAGGSASLEIITEQGEPPETVTVTVTGGENATAVWTVAGVEIGSSAPVSLVVGQSYSVSFSPKSGYEFESGATTTFSGTATSGVNIVIEAPNATAVAVSDFALTLTGGSNAIITYTVNGGAATTYAGAPVDIPAGAAVVITAAPATGFTYSGVDVTGTGWTYSSATGNLTYEISSMSDVENLPVPNPKEDTSEGWPTGDALNALDGKSVSKAYGISGDLASVDAKVFTAWASGVGGIAYANRATTTYSAECFLLNIANDSSAEAIASAKAAASTAIKITAITFDGNGDPVITAPDSYGNGKVEIEGTESLAPISWHEKTDGDYFFRAKLVIDEVEDAS